MGCAEARCAGNVEMAGGETEIACLRGWRQVRFFFVGFSRGCYRGGDLTILSVTYGDLNVDGQEDAAVDALLHRSPNWQHVYVLTLRNGVPTLLGGLRSGSRADGGLLKGCHRRKHVVLDFADPRRRIADCLL